MVMALNWDKRGLNSLLRKIYYHENSEYFCISGTVTRTEEEVIKPGYSSREVIWSKPLRVQDAQI